MAETLLGSLDAGVILPGWIYPQLDGSWRGSPDPNLDELRASGLGGRIVADVVERSFSLRPSALYWLLPRGAESVAVHG